MFNLHLNLDRNHTGSSITGHQQKVEWGWFKKKKKTKAMKDKFFIDATSELDVVYRGESGVELLLCTVRLGPHRGSQPAGGGIYHSQGIAEAGIKGRDEPRQPTNFEHVPRMFTSPLQQKKTYSINPTMLYSQNNISMEL